MLENHKPKDPTVPLHIAVNTCFDKLEININRTSLESLRSHLNSQRQTGDYGEDTDFDC